MCGTLPIFSRKKADNPDALQLDRRGANLARNRSIRVMKLIPKMKLTRGKK